MKIGVDIYTLRFQGWDAYQHLEYAKRIGLDIVHFSDLEPFASLDDEYLQQVRAKADALGLDLEVGMMSICETSTIFDASRGSAVDQVSQMLKVANILGSPVLRCVLGTGRDRVSTVSLAQNIDNAVATLKACRAQAMDLGITFAVENHAGDMQARELKSLIELAGPEYVGACIDPGNAVWVAEDPMVTLDYLAPYVAASHARDSRVWPHPQGAAVQWVAMGDGNVNIEGWARRYQKLCPDKPLTMEIITGFPPKVLNYLEPAYWDAYPETPAWELARFEALVRKGQPLLAPTLSASGEMPAEYRAALAVQQRLDLERSVAWCRAQGLSN